MKLEKKHYYWIAYAIIAIVAYYLIYHNWSTISGWFNGSNKRISKCCCGSPGCNDSNCNHNCPKNRIEEATTPMQVPQSAVKSRIPIEVVPSRK